MTIRTINIPDALNDFLEAQIQAGHYTDADEFFRALIASAQKRSEIDDKLEAALDEIERGEGSPWQKGDFQRLGEAILQSRTKVP
jgi:putative addiction module CopG family antidote